MRELGLISKQPSSPAYKKATVVRPDIPNTLKIVSSMFPSQIRFGAVTLPTFRRNGNGTTWPWYSLDSALVIVRKSDC